MSNVVDELLAQRDAVLFGTHRHTFPQGRNEACAVIRIDETGKYHELSERGKRYLAEARIKLGFLTGLERNIPRRKWLTFLTWSHTAWNDWSRRPTSQVVDALDETVRIAKGDTERDRRGAAAEHEETPA